MPLKHLRPNCARPRRISQLTLWCCEVCGTFGGAVSMISVQHLRPKFETSLASHPYFTHRPFLSCPAQSAVYVPTFLTIPHNPIMKTYTTALVLAASQAVSAHSSHLDHTRFARLTRLQHGISNLLHRGIDKCAPLADGLPTSTVDKIKANLAGSADINSIWVVGMHDMQRSRTWLKCLHSQVLRWKH